jgi:hypothetical protein
VSSTSHFYLYRIAHAGHFGSYLLDEVDRPIVLSIVKTLAENLSIPVFVKIRLLNSLPETIELVRQLSEAGAALVAVHGRYRVNLVGRSGPGKRCCDELCLRLWSAPADFFYILDAMYELHSTALLTTPIHFSSVLFIAGAYY